MKKQSLKEILKPLIKKYIKEVMLEEGLLSTVIKEVITGYKMSIEENMGSQNVSLDKLSEVQKESVSKKNNLNEVRERLNKAVAKNGYGDFNAFEGVTPAPQESKSSQYSPLRDMDPSDPGVNLDMFSKMTDPSIWAKLSKGKKNA